MKSPRSLALALSLLLPLEAALAEPPSARVLERYREMLRAQPVDGTALDRLWKAYAEMGKTEELLKEYEGVGATFAGRMVLGHLHHRAGDEQAAANDFAEAARIEPANALPQLALGKLKLDGGKPEEAAEAYARAVELLSGSEGKSAPSPQLIEALLALGSAHLAADHIALAAEAWEKIAAAQPENLELRRKLVDQYLANHLPERAVPHLEYLGAHAAPAERPAALQKLAAIHQAAGRPDEAIKTLESALSMTARGNWLRPELEGQLIRTYQRFGRTEELEARWKKQLAESPRDAGAYLQLAELYHRLGELEQERGAVEGLVKLLPKSAEYRLRLARLLAQSDRLAEAAAQYDGLLREQPANADLILERAELEVRQDQSAAAQARIKALLVQQGARPRAENETLRAKALEFFREHRFWSEAEAMLRRDAAGGGVEAVSALAQFLFTQHRDAEAEQVLRQQVRASEPKPAQAAALLQVSASLKQQNLLQPALKAAREAVGLAKGDATHEREALLAAGELELAVGEHDAARATVEAAGKLAATPAETAQVDQRLFEILRQVAEKEQAARGPRMSPAALAALVDSEPSPELSAYEASLRTMAEQGNSADAWLRVARWQLWCRNARAAGESVDRALAIDPDSVAVHQFAIDLAASQPQAITAQEHLERLMQLDPANLAQYRRRLAQLELQSGQLGQARARYEALAQEFPGNLELLAELAAAQQATEQWEAALATWKRVYALSPPARKRESLAPLLRISVKMGQPRAAAELLLGETDTRADLKEKRELFSDLLGLCTKNGLLSWLRGRWEQRRQRTPDDFFTETAYAELLKVDGDRVGAFETLSRALFTAPDPAAALPELVRQAEELRRFEAAIDFQERLTKLGPQDRPANYVKLAELQERSFDIPGAEKTWAQVTRRFPREPDALRRAVDFHQRNADAVRAADLLRKLRAVEGATPSTAYQLALLDVETGRTAEAEQELEEILRAPAAPTEGEQFKFPDLRAGNPGQLQNEYLSTVRNRRGKVSPETMRSLRGFWVELPANVVSERDRRLDAIRLRTALIRSRDDAAAMRKWVERWQAADEAHANEALWAFYFAGAIGPALDLLERLITAEPSDETLQQGYIWVALQMGGFDRLGRWNQDRARTVKQRDFLRIALGQFLRAQGSRLPTALMGGLWPEGARLRLWEGAEVCATNGNFAEAIALGRRALAEDDPENAEHRLQLAHWRVCLGDIATARTELLELARTPAELLERPTFIALHEAWLLTPEAERKGLATQLEEAAAHSDLPVHAVLTRLALAGLQKDEHAAKAQIDALLAMRVTVSRTTEELNDPTSTRLTPGARSWSFLLSTGMNLQAWKLDRVAAELWERALADRAMLRLEGEQAQEFAREVRARLFALRLARAPRARFDEVLAEYGRGMQQLEGAVVLGENLESIGALPAALEVFRRLWEKDPANNQPLRNVLNICRALDDSETMETVLGRCVAERLFSQNDNVQRDLVLQLVDAIERRNDLVAAQATLAQALEASPFEARLLQKQAQLFERMGKLADAEASWRRLLSTEPGHVGGRTGLATFLEGQGKFHAAIAVLHRSPPPGSEAQLARLYVRDEQPDEAAALVERLAGPPYLNAVENVAGAMLEKGYRKQARLLLQTAIGRTNEPAAALPAQAKLLESLGDADEATVQRELHKLRRMAGDDPTLIGVYFTHATRLAKQLKIEGEVGAELESAWAEGAGLPQAGIALLGWKAQRGEAGVETVLRQFLGRRDLSVDTLTRLQEPLSEAKRPELAARVQEMLVQLQPLEDERVLKLVTLLHEAGQDAQATAALEKWGARAAVNDDLAGKIAGLWMELHRPDRAEASFAQVTGASYARSFEPYVGHARLRLSQGDVSGARRLLRQAYRFPANREYGALVAWSVAAKKLDDPEQVAQTFELTAAQMRGYAHASLAESDHAAEVLGLFAKRPTLLQAGDAERLRTLAVQRELFTEASALFELLVGQSPVPAEARSEYARLLDAWADADALAGRAAEAQAHLTQAAELDPAHWPVAEKLWKALKAANRMEEARGAVERYLMAAGKDAPERKRAELLLRQ